MKIKSKTLAKTSLIAVLLMVVSTVAYAMTMISWPNELIGFEEYNPVYTTYVEPGTDLESASLPESVRGIVSIPDEMDVTTFTQVEPTVDSSTGTEYYDYYDYGYVRATDATEKYANDELVIYTVFYNSDSEDDVGYRVYGYLEGSATVWFTCDADGTITGAILDVPVEWSGEYDSETYGEYTFTASITEDSEYTYNGEMPTSLVVVYDWDSIDCSHDGDCDCYSTTETIASTHTEVDTTEMASYSVLSGSMDEVSAISEITEDEYGISTMAETTGYSVNSYSDIFGTDSKYGYGVNGLSADSGIIMANLISTYVTSSISTSGNDKTDQATGDWIDYLNTVWYNIVGGITTSTDDVGDATTVWTSKVTWIDTTVDGFDGTFVGGKWYGTGEGTGSSDFLFESTQQVVNGTNENAFYSDSENEWYIYTGEQLLYALLHYSSGDTIIFQNDIDLNGQYYCWPDIELTKDLTIDGGGYTIYNLGAFIDYSDAEYEYSSTYTNDEGVDVTTYGVDTRSGFISFVYGNYEVYDLNFDTGKLYADTEYASPNGVTVSSVNLSLFGIEGGANVDFDNIDIENYLVCSNAAAVSVFVSVGLAADWSTTTGYTTGITSYEESDSLSDYITMDTYDFRVAANNCSVSDSYIYGTDHVGSMGSYTCMSFTNCYAVGNTLVGTGYHSGAFVSCLNNAGYFESCFAADNYLYSASQSGGFVGYSGDSADYVNCYASGIVEGYTYIGGFVGATRVGHDYVSATETINSDGTTSYSYAYSSRNYSTFTNCYSTTLVGMRTETNNSGGFVGLVAYMENYNPTTAAVFDSCYAAGEVGSTQTVTDSNENYVGGFVGYDQTYGNDDTSFTTSLITSYINCYYDKQTTAMREWVSGRYHSNDDDNIYDIDIIGVLTSDSDKYGTGLISEPAEVHTAEDAEDPEFGFIGFTNDDDWVYTTEEHYPELTVFANASSDTWGENVALVQAYSLASTATVILDTWDYGYTWDEDGIRSDTKELYYGTYTSEDDEGYDGLDDHIADRYTYDTVREVVSNATITHSASFDEMVEGGIKTQSYMYYSEYMLLYDDSKNVIGYTDEYGEEHTDKTKEELIEDGIIVETKYNGVQAFDLDNNTDTLTVDAPGIDWYDITESVGAEVGSRPIRLISFMNVDAGDDQVLSATDIYDHRDDAYFTMVDTIKENMIVALDSDETWSTSVMQIYPEDNEAFHAVSTESTNFTASDSAWINTEIWRAYIVGEDLTMDDFELVEGETDIYSYTDNTAGAEIVTSYYYIGQDGVFYYLVDWTTDTSITETTQIELYTSTANDDGEFDLYASDYSVKVNGTDPTDEANVTQAKWNGIIPLYPDVEEEQYYIVRYYWVLGNGRYRSDYKIIEIDEPEGESYNLTVNVYNDDEDSTYNESVMKIYASGYGAGDEYQATTIFGTSTSKTYTTITYEEDDGTIIGAVDEGEDSYVSWLKATDDVLVTKTVLTLTTNSGYEVASVTTEGDLSEGDTIKVPIEVFYLEYDYATDENGGVTETITGQSTMVEEGYVTYEVKEDESGGLYLAFTESSTVFNYDGEEIATIDNTNYNVTFDIYVQELAQITITKVVTGEEADTTEAQSFVINVTGDLYTINETTDDTTTTETVISEDVFNTQVVLKATETSNPIVAYLDPNETVVFYIDETVPMEFDLFTITYTINGGTVQDYDSAVGITLSAGDEIEVTVTNVFDEEAYFKSRDDVNNNFTYSTDSNDGTD